MSAGSCCWFQRVQVTHQHNKQGHEQQSAYLFHACTCALVCLNTQRDANLQYMRVIPSARHNKGNARLAPAEQNGEDEDRRTDANQAKTVLLR